MKAKRVKYFSEFVNESGEKEMVLPADVLRISDLYTAAGKKLYVVGGAVRDFLQNKIPKDFDLATDATPEESLRILKPEFKTLEVGKSFGVVVAVTSEGEYEIATFRKDGRSSDFSDFVRYIEKIKPNDYEKGLRLLSQMSGKKLP